MDPIYTVYTLTDGIAEDIYAGDNYDDAYVMSCTRVSGCRITRKQLFTCMMPRAGTCLQNIA